MTTETGRGCVQMVKNLTGTVDHSGVPLLPRGSEILLTRRNHTSQQRPQPRGARSQGPRRRVLSGLVVAGLFLAGFGGAIIPASAAPHNYLLHLADGTQTQWSGEPGTAPSAVTVAGVEVTVTSVDDLGEIVPDRTDTAPDVTPPPDPDPPADTTPTDTTPTETTPTDTTPTDTTPTETTPTETTPEHGNGGSDGPSSSSPSSGSRLRILELGARPREHDDLARLQDRGARRRRAREAQV